MPKNTKKQNEFCERLWYMYEPYIRKLCNVKLGDHPEEVKDIVATTYMCLCVAVNEKRDIKDERAWLLRTADNLINTKFRDLSKKREKEIALFSRDNTLSFDLPYTMDFIENMISDETLQDKIIEVFHELNDKEKHVFTLFHIDHYSYKDIADMIGSTEKAVKQFSYRTKRKINWLVELKSEKAYEEILKK